MKHYMLETRYDLAGLAQMAKRHRSVLADNVTYHKNGSATIKVNSGDVQLIGYLLQAITELGEAARQSD